MMTHCGNKKDPMPKNPVVLPAVLVLALFSQVVLAQAPRNVGFYYGHEAPVSALMAYDWLVLQRDRNSTSRLDTLNDAGVAPIAYVSVGEMARSHKQFAQLPATARLGRNTGWDSAILDIRQPAVRAFLLDRLIDPAFRAGYHGVFLDTLDSYRLTQAGQDDPAAFVQALATLIGRIRERHPDARIIINRGFELPESVHAQVDALAFESYRRGYDAGRKRYRPVSDADRQWLRGQLDHWRDRHPDKPLIAIDYVRDASDAPALARQLRQDGFVPYVTDPDLQRLGPTEPQRIKREVLVLHDAPDGLMAHSAAHRYGGVLLERLGYIPVYRDMHAPLPSEPLDDRFAGIVAWWEGGAKSRRVCRWLSQHRGNLPLVVMGRLPPDRNCEALIRSDTVTLPALPVTTTPRQASVGRFEGTHLPAMPDSALPRAEGVSSWLEITDAQDTTFTPVYTAEHLGVALEPYLFEPGPEDERYWLFDPLAFLAEALGGPLYPTPDATTESGQRILTAHIDGDGFVSRAELEGSPLGATVIMDQIIKRYRVPHTVSVIEAETSPDGIYPATSAEAERIARQLFRLDNVEVASHSYSHPFFWQIIEDGSRPLPVFADYGYALGVPGYKPVLQREIPGSIDYINRRLAPADKPTNLFLWTGDALPGERALKAVRSAGVLNVNGGDTHPLPYASQLAGVWPMARPVGDELQIYAPVMNENVYTNLWHGPYYGFRDVIDTFRILENYQRLKPLSIYYHFYSGTKPAALNALKAVYDDALSRPVTPLYLSQYARRARFNYRSAMLRDSHGRYTWRGIGAPHTVRIDPAGQYPDLAASQGVAGFHDDAGNRYVHLTGSQPTLALRDTPPEGPYLQQANAVLTHWSRRRVDDRWRIELGFSGIGPLSATLAGTGHCRVIRGASLSVKGTGRPVQLGAPGKNVNSATLECR